MKAVNGILALLTAGWLSVGAIAADNEYKETKDRSRNPITGTVTDKKTVKKKVTTASGDTSNTEITEKKKYKKDGSVETHVETESDAESNRRSE